ncbi:MAG: hypothetical protein F4Y04_05405 [Chloroflexi bacterium]|nr:hypothetical protein [Chloroflexota bacterium]
MLEVISLGAGVQSTTMALMAAHGEIEPMPDVAIFADTGAEPPEVYEHLDWLKGGNVLPFPVRIVQFSDMVEDLERTAHGEIGVAGRKDGYLAAPFHTVNADGSRGMLRRECTQNYKIREIEAGIKDVLGRPRDKAIRARKPLVRQWIGISSDEAHRVKWIGPGWSRKRYPFLGQAIEDDPQDLWMSRRDCEAWLRAHDYPIPPKSACTFCPYRSNAEWRALRDNSPEGWKQAVEIDRLIRDMPAKSRAGLRLGGELYVHRSGQPLEEVDLDGTDQMNLWDAECEGMCGL